MSRPAPRGASHQALQQYGDQQKCKPGERVQVANHRVGDDQSVHSPLAGQHQANEDHRPPEARLDGVGEGCEPRRDARDVKADPQHRREQQRRARRADHLCGDHGAQ